MAPSNLTLPAISYITETSEVCHAIRLSNMGVSCYQEALKEADRIVLLAEACWSMEQKYGDKRSTVTAGEFRKIALGLRPQLERLYEKQSL